MHFLFHVTQEFKKSIEHLLNKFNCALLYFEKFHMKIPNSITSIFGLCITFAVFLPPAQKIHEYQVENKKLYI